MYSDRSESSGGSGYARFSTISSSINSEQSIGIYTVISNSTSTTYDNISEGFYDRQIGFITPTSGRNGELPRIRDDNPVRRNSSNQEHTKNSKRQCFIVILSVLFVVILTTVATIALLYLQGQDPPNDIGNTLSLNRSYLRRINGTEIFSDCKDLKLFGNDSDGLYTVYPDPLTETPVVVYCDMTTDAGGWTVFQHRRDGSVYFFQSWDSYKNGFGEPSGEHWIGNDNLHKLTTLGTTDLYVRLEAFSGDWYFAKYGDFSVADESDGYRLRLKAGSYEGNADDKEDTSSDDVRLSPNNSFPEYSSSTSSSYNDHTKPLPEYPSTTSSPYMYQNTTKPSADHLPDPPNDIGNTLSLNRSYLRRINGREIFSDCKDLKLFGNDSDGLYTVYPDPLTETPVVVYCDMTTDAGGWTVFQHRRDGSVNFFQILDSYKNGFGHPSWEHWIGNDNLHKLTTLGTTDLYVRLEAFSGDWYFAKYGDFSVADESDGYRLRLKAGSYEGNAAMQTIGDRWIMNRCTSSSDIFF
ncbi:uncharacterized protein [Magallana gigas]|uniref:uncharacterized protein isoform X11 n=1 Tax=Magallana gigas TaxID=29159 RepID=UPI00333F9924